MKSIPFWLRFTIAMLIFGGATDLGAVTGTLHRHLYGGVLIDDKDTDPGQGTCQEICTDYGPLGQICEERCLDPTCSMDEGRITNYLHVTNPNATAVDLQIEVWYVDGTLAYGSADWALSQGKKTFPLDSMFQQHSTAYVIVSSNLPVEAVVETLYQESPAGGDPEITFDWGLDMPLRPLTSTRWRSGPFWYFVGGGPSGDENALRYVLYVINPTDDPARGQIRLSTGGPMGAGTRTLLGIPAHSSAPIPCPQRTPSPRISTTSIPIPVTRTS